MLKWNILKGNNSDQLTLTDLFAVFTTGKQLLFNINTQTQQPQIVKLAEDIFSDRISATVIGGKTYQLVLKDVYYNDSISFKLEAQTRNGDDSSKIRSGEIKLTVIGMEHSIICFLPPVEVRKI